MLETTYNLGYVRDDLSSNNTIECQTLLLNKTKHGLIWKKRKIYHLPLTSNIFLYHLMSCHPLPFEPFDKGLKSHPLSAAQPLGCCLQAALGIHHPNE